MNGISKSQKGKEFKKKNMIEKWKKSVEWKSNSHISLPDCKFSTKKRDKLYKKTMLIKSNLSKLDLASWEK